VLYQEAKDFTQACASSLLAVDGTETAVAVLWGPADATLVDATVVAVLRGPAIVNGKDLVFTGTPTAADLRSRVSDEVSFGGINFRRYRGNAAFGARG